MNINISDDLDPKERREILEVYPIIYALHKFKGSFTEASKFLGITVRTLYDRRKKNLLILSATDQRAPREDYPRNNYSDPLKKIYEYHITNTEKSFWFRKLGEKEQKEIRNRIKKLYSDVK